MNTALDIAKPSNSRKNPENETANKWVKKFPSRALKSNRSERKLQSEYGLNRSMTMKE